VTTVGPTRRDLLELVGFIAGTFFAAFAFTAVLGVLVTA